MEVEIRNYLEKVFDTFPESIIISDLDGKIMYLNTAAFRLFEVSSEACYKGASFQQFLQSYQMDDRQPQVVLSMGGLEGCS